MFKQNKWQEWYDNLPKSTQEYLITQAVWRDIDIFKFSAIAFIVGFILGKVL